MLFKEANGLVSLPKLKGSNNDPNAKPPIPKPAFFKKFRLNYLLFQGGEQQRACLARALVREPRVNFFQNIISAYNHHLDVFL